MAAQAEAQAQTLSREQILSANKRVYFRIAVLLAVITLVEFGIIYVESWKAIMVPVLFILSAVKFVYVASIFMHLKDDGKVLSGFFYSGFFIALATAVGIAAIFVAWYA